MHVTRIDPARALTRSHLRVRFCDTDLMGIVHHANYLAYFEAGRVEWLRKRGVTYADWATQGFHLPVVEASVRYRAPARFDDVILVETTIVELRTVSLRFDYRLLRGDTVLADGNTRLACVDAKHALQRFPKTMLDVLSSGESAPGDDHAT